MTRACTDVVLHDQRRKLLVSRRKVRPKNGGERSDEIAGRRDEDRVVLGRVLRRLIGLILVRVLLADGFLLKDLDSDIREVVGTCDAMFNDW